MCLRLRPGPIRPDAMSLPARAQLFSPSTRSLNHNRQMARNDRPIAANQRGDRKCSGDKTPSTCWPGIRRGAILWQAHRLEKHLSRLFGRLRTRFGAGSAAPARAADYDIGVIPIAQPWARVTPKGASGALTITNNGTTPDRLSCVSSDAGAQCQIHTMTTEGAVIKMRPVEEAGDQAGRAGPQAAAAN